MGKDLFNNIEIKKKPQYNPNFFRKRKKLTAL